MSEATAAAPASAAESTNQSPETVQQDAQSSDPNRRLSKAERKQQLVDRLRQGRERKQAERSQSQPQEQPTEPAKADATEPEAGDEKSADDKPKAEKQEPERELELRVAKLSRELRDAKADAIEWKPKAEKFDALMGRFEKAKGDPYAAVQLLPDLFGMDFGQMAEFVVKNADKFAESKRYADLPPDLREEVEMAKKERAERQAREKQEAEQRKYQERYNSYATKIREHLEVHADDYPLTAALGWAAGSVAERCAREGGEHGQRILREMEENLRTNISGAISNDRVLKTLLADKEMRAKIAAALGPAPKPNNSPATGASLQSGATEQRNGSATLTNRSTSSDTAAPVGARPSKDERKRQIAEAFKAQFGR